MKTITMADLFCGAGGTSTGALEAARKAGYSVKLTAINHWSIAVATHTANHAEARHLCTSIDEVDPRKLYKPGKLDVLWASPECTHHSRARGGKPMHDQSRATAWCVTRWAEALMPGVIFVENVQEFLDWGPLGTNGRPLASKKGATFRAWVAVLESLGYKVDHKVLRAADYGAPTTRERLFVQAVRGRRQILWPSRTHAPTKEVERLRVENDMFGLTLKPWVAAREIIDWKLEGRWLDEMPGKKQYDGLPLSPKTLNRIHAGLRRFGLKGFIIPGQTVTCDSRGIGLVQPFIVPHFGERDGQSGRAHSVEAPLPAVTSQGAGSLVEPFLVELKGTAESQVQGSGKSIEEPLSTIATSGAHHSLVQPFIVPIDHTGNGRMAVNDIDEPLSTVTCENRHALVDPFLVPVAHGGGEERAQSVDVPMPTICGNRGDLAVIEPHLLPQQSCGLLRPVSEPAPTITCGGAVALVEPFLTKFYGTAEAADINDPLGTVTTKDRFALVTPTVVIDGQKYLIRLRWRMLQPHELAAGQSFPSGYQFCGNKTEQVKQIGNAVPPDIAEALMRVRLEEAA